MQYSVDSNWDGGLKGSGKLTVASKSECGCRCGGDGDTGGGSLHAHLHVQVHSCCPASPVVWQFTVQLIPFSLEGPHAALHA